MFTTPKKLLASGLVAATLAAGGLTVAAVNPLGTAGAQEQTAPPTTAASGAEKPARGHVLKDVLDGLVAKGTLTQAQADAVTAGVKAEVKERAPARRRHRAVKGAVVTAAKTIGIPAKDLVAELKDGKSIAAVATAHDVDPQKVIDALVAEATARIDKAVAAGKVTPEKAATAKAKLPTWAAKIVNATRKA